MNHNDVVFFFVFLLLATREASKANNIRSNEKCYVSRYITILIFINLNLENFDAETIERMQMICNTKKHSTATILLNELNNEVRNLLSKIDLINDTKIQKTLFSRPKALKL